MTTYILGGAGFIGTSIASVMNENKSRPVVVDVPHRLKRCRSQLEGVEQVPLDSLSTMSLVPLFKRGDNIICLQWSSQPASSMMHLVDDAQTDIIGMIDLFTAAINSGVKRIIFASSGGTVYGNTNRSPIPEDQPLAPVSAYGAAKVAVEAYLSMLAVTYGIVGISLRVGNPYGPYQLSGTPTGVIAHFIRCLQEQKPITIFGDGTKVRDYIAVTDVASAFAHAASKTAPSGAYNIGSSQGVSVNQIVSTLEKMTSSKFEIIKAEDRSFDAKSIVLDCSKFMEATGWAPQLNLEDGIRSMLDSSYNAGH